MNTLFEKIKQKAGQKPMPKLFTDADFESLHYYLERPPGTRVAKEQDFLDHSGNYIIKKPYLIHSIVDPDKYWACRTQKGFNEQNDFETFLELGRVYVFEK